MSSTDTPTPAEAEALAAMGNPAHLRMMIPLPFPREAIADPAMRASLREEVLAFLRQPGFLEQVVDQSWAEMDARAEQEDTPA